MIISINAFVFEQLTRLQTGGPIFNTVVMSLRMGDGVGVGWEIVNWKSPIDNAKREVRNQNYWGSPQPRLLSSEQTLEEWMRWGTRGEGGGVRWGNWITSSLPDTLYVCLCLPFIWIVSMTSGNWWRRLFLSLSSSSLSLFVSVSVYLFLSILLTSSSLHITLSMMNL